MIAWYKAKYFIGLFLLVFQTSVFCQELLKGKVVRIADGDTITLLDSSNTQKRIRFYGIDCPENGQAFSNVAKKFTSSLVYGKNVDVIVKDIDGYGRVVGIIIVDDSVNVNLALLRSGFAWHYKHFDKSTIFADAERTAREKKLGLWSHPDALPPWVYRRQK